MKLYIVRHGETDANVQHLCQGQTDGKLNEVGMEQAVAVGKRLQDLPLDAIYSSDLGRARETIQTIVQLHDNPLAVNYTRALRERFFGSYQGKRFPDDLNRFVPPPETETVKDIEDRLSAFIHYLKSNHKNDESILLLSHGFTIKVLLSLFKIGGISQLQDMAEIKNASISIVALNDKWSDSIILLENDISHLQ